MRFIACLAMAVGCLLGTATPSTADPTDDIAERLREARVYNAPGREDPVDPQLTEDHADSGLLLRIAAFRYDQVVDGYAQSLAELFPGEVILVARGNMVDVESPYPAEAKSAVDYVYHSEWWTSDQSVNETIGEIVDRLGALVQAKDFGPPQPSWEPSFMDRFIAVMVPVSLIGTAAVISGSVLLVWRRRRVRQTSSDQLRLRNASAMAMARIGRLGAELLSADERESRLAEASERYDTARTLYDQALTADAMNEVEKTADEGFQYLRYISKATRRGVRRHPPASRRVREAHAPTAGLRARDFLAAGLIAGFGAMLIVILTGLVSETILGNGKPRDWSERTEEVIAGLQHSAVDDMSDVLDHQLVGELVGDRPMVVVLFDGAQSSLLSCQEIASVRTTDAVILFGVDSDGRYDGELCLGPEYSDSAVRGEYGKLWTTVRNNTAWRDSGDPLGALRELVFAYDVQAVADHRPDKVPSRALVAPAPRGDRAISVFVIFFGPMVTAVLYGVFRRSGRLLVRRGAGGASHEAAGTRLNRLADVVLHPPKPTVAEDAARQADLAERYVLLLRDYEAVDMRRVERQLDELEQEVTR